MTTTKRARKGGEIGANGEFYEGGKFINTVPENAKRHGATARRDQKAEIEPYIWAVVPEGKRSLYRNFAGVFGKVINGIAVVNCSEQTLAYFKTSRQEAEAMAAAYNAGERWL